MFLIPGLGVDPSTPFHANGSAIAGETGLFLPILHAHGTVPAVYLLHHHRNSLAAGAALCLERGRPCPPLGAFSRGIEPTATAAPAASLTATLQPLAPAGSAPLGLTFTGLGHGGDVASPYNYTWTFGDGSPPIINNGTIVQTADTVSHTFAPAGTFTVNLTVADSRGATARAHSTVQATDPLVVVATAAPPVLTSGETSILTAVASGGLPPYIYTWTAVPAGCRAKAANLTCTPTATGLFSIGAQVVDAANNRSFTTVNLSVNPVIGAHANIATQYVCSNGTGVLQAQFVGTATGGSPPLVYSWDPGDGTPPIANASASHNYSLGRDYNATFTVIDQTGAKGQVTTDVAADFPNCDAAASVPQWGPPPALVVAISGAVVAIAILLYLNFRPVAKPALRPPPRASPPAARPLLPATGTQPRR
jgi:PKD repeat protein